MAILIQITDGVTTNKFQIDKPVIKIGRTPKNDIYIDDPLVSKEHAIIEAIQSKDSPDGVEFFIKDLESTNNTFVNDKKITRMQLTKDDIIRIGLNSFKFLLADEADFGKTTKLHKSWIPGIFYTK